MALRDAPWRPDVTETLHWKLREYPRRVGARRENPTGFSRGSVKGFILSASLYRRARGKSRLGRLYQTSEPLGNDATVAEPRIPRLQPCGVSTGEPQPREIGWGSKVCAWGAAWGGAADGSRRQVAAQALRVASMCSVTLTLSATTAPPVSSNAFQFRPNSLRLIVVSAVKPARCNP